MRKTFHVCGKWASLGIIVTTAFSGGLKGGTWRRFGLDFLQCYELNSTSRDSCSEVVEVAIVCEYVLVSVGSVGD